jgi:exopolysaccharide biosynthesis WecB/TagA/CpsF family protein
MDPLFLGPLRVTGGRADVWAQSIADDVGAGRGRRIAFANTHLLYCALRERELADCLDTFLLFNDGVGLELLARAIAHRGFEDNLNGTDFTPLLLSAAPQGSRVFLVGGAPEVLEKVLGNWRSAFCGLEFCGVADGYQGVSDPELVQRIAEARPDIVIAALGNPLQERWIARSSLAAPQAIWIGVGALFDMVAERHPRAPMLMRKLRLEWLHRFAREPGRLWKRYTYEVLVVALALMAQRRVQKAVH